MTIVNKKMNKEIQRSTLLPSMLHLALREGRGYKHGFCLRRELGLKALTVLILQFTLIPQQCLLQTGFSV